MDGGTSSSSSQTSRGLAAIASFNPFALFGKSFLP
ncbi:hypothetical protein HJC23_006169 [Cyclotella cryptica]|uniref:Fucoxanthin chlorophyll a/c binding protein n=1 Tax=Cyclotella cryptica TaxID=29204 RepID=A0ABD3Q055_9STRA